LLLLWLGVRFLVPGLLPLLLLLCSADEGGALLGLLDLLLLLAAVGLAGVPAAAPDALLPAAGCWSVLLLLLLLPLLLAWDASTIAVDGTTL
jgi:hypothetical protein